MGRRQFEQVVASAVRQQLKSNDITFRDNVAVNGSEVFDVFAPSGVIGSMESLYITVERPVEATTGEHVLFLKNVLGASYGAIRQPYNVRIGFNAFEWFNTETAIVVSPADNVVQSVKGSKFTENFPFRFDYQNYSDVQTNIDRIFTSGNWTNGRILGTTGATYSDGDPNYLRTNFIPAMSETRMKFDNKSGKSLSVYVFEYSSTGTFLRFKLIGANLASGSSIFHTLGDSTRQIKLMVVNDTLGLVPADMVNSTYNDSPHRTYRFAWLEVDSPQ